jgi:hypothetical protein
LLEWNRHRATPRPLTWTSGDGSRPRSTSPADRHGYQDAQPFAGCSRVAEPDQPSPLPEANPPPSESPCVYSSRLRSRALAAATTSARLKRR